MTNSMNPQTCTHPDTTAPQGAVVSGPHFPAYCCGAHITRELFDGRLYDVARCGDCGEVITATDVLTGKDYIGGCDCLGDPDPEALW